MTTEINRALRDCALGCALIISIFTALCLYASVTVAWDRHPDPAVTGYTVHYGTNSRQYAWSIAIPSAQTTTQEIAFPFAARWYIALTASAGPLESPYSNELTWNHLPAPPDAHGTPGIILTLAESHDHTNWTPVPGPGLWLPATNPVAFFRLIEPRIEKIETPAP